jgi:hypothetical protein
MKILSLLFGSLLKCSLVSANIGCDNCLGWPHQDIIKYCNLVVGDKNIGVGQDSVLAPLAANWCSKIVNNFECCMPDSKGTVCSTDVQTCTRITLTKRELSKHEDFQESKASFGYQPRKSDISNIRQRDNAAVCCAVANSISAGAITQFFKNGLVPNLTADDSIRAAIVTLVAALSVQWACNQVYGMHCVVSDFNPFDYVYNRLIPLLQFQPLYGGGYGGGFGGGFAGMPPPPPPPPL